MCFPYFYPQYTCLSPVSFLKEGKRKCGYSSQDGAGGGRALVKNIWPRNVINLEKNVCIMTILMSFSISKSPNQANKKPLPFAYYPEHKRFLADIKKILLETNQKKKIASNQVFLLASIRLTFVSFDLCTVCIY